MNGPLIIVADTSPLIALSTMGLLDFLPELFRQIYIPEAVLNECLCDLSKPMAMTINKAVASGVLAVSAVMDKQRVAQLSDILDLGEAEAITLAKEKNACVLMDEKAGRRVAKREGLKCKGSLYCLVECKKQGLIPSAADRIITLREKGYYLDEALISTVLAMCGE